MGTHKEEPKAAATPAPAVPEKITDVPEKPAVKVEDEAKPVEAKHDDGKHDDASTSHKAADAGKEAGHATSGGSK